MENKYLLWVKIARPFLSITALEQFIGIPFGTLHRYLANGEFPEKHLGLVKEKLEPVCQLEPTWVLCYVGQLLADRQVFVDAVNATRPDSGHSTEEQVWLAEEVPKEMLPAGEVDPCQSVVANAKQEQILDDLVRLYSVLRIEAPLIAAAVKEVIQARDPMMRHVFAYMGESTEPVSLEEIRRMPLRPGGK